MKTLRIFFIGIAALLVFGACTAGKVYNEKDTDITVKEGGQFTIKLEENMTTGYTWKFSIGDETIIKLVSDDYESDDKSGMLSGSGGKRILVFEGLKKGGTEMAFVYEPTYKSNVSQNAYVYRVKVE